MGEWLHRELQCSPARRTPRRRDLLHAQRGQDHRGKLVSALQNRASAWIARLQAACAGGLHPGIRAGGPATPTSDAARAGATTIIALTIKLDPSVGADQGSLNHVSVLIDNPFDDSSLNGIIAKYGADDPLEGYIKILHPRM